MGLPTWTVSADSVFARTVFPSGVHFEFKGPPLGAIPGQLITVVLDSGKSCFSSKRAPWNNALPNILPDAINKWSWAWYTSKFTEVLDWCSSVVFRTFHIPSIHP